VNDWSLLGALRLLSCHHEERRESERGFDTTVAVVGNPNVGKSTLFTRMTGEITRIGNWPGVTVERKEGVRVHRGVRIRFVDLPGTYGLTATSLEETIARNYIISGEPDIVLVLVDATAPERSLYLAVQVLELTPNVIVVFTKTDEMEKLGIHVHFDKLESILKVPVVATSAIRGTGIRELLDLIVDFPAKRGFRSEQLRVDYGGLEPFILEVMHAIQESSALRGFPKRWAAVRLLEGDDDLESKLVASDEKELLAKVREIREAIKRGIGKDPVELVVSARFNYVHNLASKVVVRVERRRGIEEALEKLLSKPVLGPLASALMLFLSLLIVFSVNTGFPLNVVLDHMGLPNLAELVEGYSVSGLLERGFALLGSLIKGKLAETNPVLASLVADGIAAGVGAVLSFLPLVLMVFVFLSALEDSGVLPRLAISIDFLLNRFGFTGKAIYPLVVSLGCNVPGVLASRAASEEKERLQTVVATPFVPCQARLVVLLAFLTALFESPLSQALALISFYATGILVFLATGAVLRRLVFKVKEPPELILEAPPIHKPNLRVVWWLSWDYTKHFLKRAGTIILGLSIVTWLLSNFGSSGFTDRVEDSLAFALGRLVSPALAPFDLKGEVAWIVGFSLLVGFVAKEAILEAIVSASRGVAGVSEAIVALGLSIPQAYAILLFATLYVPCLATVAVVYQETRSVRLTAYQILYMISAAYLLSFVAYSIAKAIL